MDAIDRRILDVLQKNNQIGMDQLGELAGLSASAAQRRVKRLRDEGVIASDVSVVDPSAVGRPLTLVVEVALERETTTHLDAFKRRMVEAPEVQQCYYVTGDGDFVLIVTVSDMGEYEDLTKRLFMADANVRHYRTSVVMNRVKASLAVPVT